MYNKRHEEFKMFMRGLIPLDMRYEFIYDDFVTQRVKVLDLRDNSKLLLPYAWFNAHGFTAEKKPMPYNWLIKGG